MIKEIVKKETGIKPELDTLLTTSIIENNFSVNSVFDDVSEGLVSKKHLSKEEAEKIKNNKKAGYLTRYRVVENVAIIAIVPFNQGVAYVFNKPFTDSIEDNKIHITSGVYENLMDCYVYRSNKISKNYLNKLEKEYYERGGVIYSNYHFFEELVLKIERNKRNKNYVNSIIFDSIFKHGFREVGRKKWSNSEITIKQKRIQCSSLKYPSDLKHTELNTTLTNKMIIGSIFGKNYKHINQLSENRFGVVCGVNNSSRYYFAYFEVEF